MKRILLLISLFGLSMLLFCACGKSKSDKVYLSETEFENDVDNEEESLEEEEKISTNKSSDNNSTGNSSEETKFTVIYVQVNGAVKNPGVYKIEQELRVFEVIELAGGITSDAATQAINMARPVIDEMVIYVPTKEEVLAGFSEETEIEFEDYELEDNTTVALINLNTASLEELMTLSGIGETKAKQIIEYREENGGFRDITEIMNISGIKQNAYDKIKDYITV